MQRRAQLTRVDQRADPFVLEAEAPLGSLLGHHEWLDEWSGGDIDVSMCSPAIGPIDDGPDAA